MGELKSYQTRIPTREIRVGDFVDQIESTRDIRGPRGGRYRFDGVLLESRVTAVGFGLGRRFGFTIRTASNPGIVLPGNLAELTTAIVRRKDES